jgi:hypothetical protein
MIPNQDTASLLLHSLNIVQPNPKLIDQSMLKASILLIKISNQVKIIPSTLSQAMIIIKAFKSKRTKKNKNPDQ